MDKVLIITGLTGCGKTKLSIPIAKKFKTDIINGDAFQVYRGMNILTAKIKPVDTNGIKHHLIDIIDPTNCYSVENYQKDVRKIIADLTIENKLPIIVGGSGLYIDSIIYDYQFPTIPKEDNSDYEMLSNDELHQILFSLNENAARKIHKNNRKRVLRAIELAKSNHLITEFNNRLVYDALVIFLETDREKAYEIINERVDEMINEGLLDEVKNLLAMKNLSITAQKAIGLKEFIPYYNNEISLDEAIEEVKKNTRHLAKRQITWFKRKDNVIHIKVDHDNFQNTIDEVTNIINSWYTK